MTLDVHYPDNQALDEEQKHRVRQRAKERDFACGSCASKDFEVGEALYLGFLFLSEEQDDYMVALTCGNPDCGSPRTGIKLHRSEFLHQVMGG